MSSIRPIQLQLLRSSRLWPNPRPSWPRCSVTFCPYGPSCAATFGSGRPYGQCAPRCKSAIRLYGPSISAAFGFDLPHGRHAPSWLSASDPRGPKCVSSSGPLTGCQHSAYKALAAPHHSDSVDSTKHVASAACQLSAYTFLEAPQPSPSADNTALVAPLLGKRLPLHP